MDFDIYQRNIRRFRLPTADNSYAIMGLAAEVGEFMGHYAKAIRDGIEDEDEFNGHLMKELGDILWFISALADDLDIRLSDVALLNIRKLESRMKRGTIQGSGDDR